MVITTTASSLTSTFGTRRNPDTRSYGPEAVALLAEAGLELFAWLASSLRAGTARVISSPLECLPGCCGWGSVECSTPLTSKPQLESFSTS